MLHQSLPLFCEIDDFCRCFVPLWQQRLLADKPRHRHRQPVMHLSEVMTLLVLFQMSGFRNLKTFYLGYVARERRRDFPNLVSYQRFVELQRDAVLPLTAYLYTRRGNCTGLSFVDSTKLQVCHNRRINQHEVFKDYATRGKSSTGWFYGFKLHLVINDVGELLAFHLTVANVDDRTPVPIMTQDLWGKLVADRGYISQELFNKLFEQGLQLVTRLRKNMKNKFMPVCDKILLRKRAIIESVNDQLKNIAQIEHTRHRSFWNFLGTVVAGLIAYTWQEKKPSLKLRRDDAQQLPAMVF